MTITRQQRLIETLVTLADTLVADFDVADLLQTLVDRSAELIDSTAAGIVLERRPHGLELVASSDERATIVELLQVAAGAGPCVECFRTGVVVSVPDIAADDSWPEFRDAALEQGFRSLHAVPLRLRETTIGAMNLMRGTVGELEDADVVISQALADVATIGILQQRAIEESEVSRAQLRRALDSRVVIEQAKGVIAHTRNVDMATAFELLRGYARAHSLGLSAVAEAVVERTLEV